MELHHINPFYRVRKSSQEPMLTFRKGVADCEPEFGYNRRLGIAPYPEETECKNIKTFCEKGQHLSINIKDR